MTDRLTHVKLGQLVPGHEINSRTMGRDEGIRELAANIRTVGLILPLSVRQLDDGTFQVVDGHRRFAALQSLNGEFGPDWRCPVLVMQGTDDASAREVSLAANIMRLPLHAADQYQAFAKLAGEGRSIDEIAERFSIKKAQVAQRLALGNLIPEWMNAFRKGEASLHDIELVASCDTARQRMVWNQMKKGDIKQWQIAGAVRANVIDGDSPLAKTIGRKAYVDAGGQIETDLFDGNVRWTSTNIIHKLQKGAFDKLVETIKAEDWAWVKHESEMPDTWRQWRKLHMVDTFASPEDEKRYDAITKRLEEIDTINIKKVSEEENTKLDEEYQKLEDEQGEISTRMVEVYPDETKARTGAVIMKNLSITYGILEPGTKGVVKDKEAKEREAEKEKVKKENGGYSNSLLSDLDSQLTIAAQVALSKQPDLAVQIFTDTLIHSLEHDLPKRDGSMSVHTSGRFRDAAFCTGKNPFELILKEEIRKWKDRKTGHLPSPQLMATLAAACLEKSGPKAKIYRYLGHSAEATLRHQWTADEAFFARLSSAQIRDALNERKLNPGNLKKGELVKFAAKHLKDWLPKYLRVGKVADAAVREGKPEKKAKKK